MNGPGMNSGSYIAPNFMGTVPLRESGRGGF